MKYEQRMELAQLTEEAIQENDIETIQKIWKIIQDDLNESEEINGNEEEWFIVLVPVEIQEIIFNQNT